MTPLILGALILGLGHPAYAARERAAEAVARIGPDLRPLLAWRVATCGDAEVASRGSPLVTRWKCPHCLGTGRCPKSDVDPDERPPTHCDVCGPHQPECFPCLERADHANS